MPPGTDTGGPPTERVDPRRGDRSAPARSVHVGVIAPRLRRYAQLLPLSLGFERRQAASGNLILISETRLARSPKNLSHRRLWASYGAPGSALFFVVTPRALEAPPHFTLAKITIADRAENPEVTSRCERGSHADWTATADQSSHTVMRVYSNSPLAVFDSLPWWTLSRCNPRLSPSARMARSPRNRSPDGDHVSPAPIPGTFHRREPPSSKPSHRQLFR
jgi:hypothetical protein